MAFVVPGPIGMTIVGLYTVGCVFLVYYCVLSVPEDSEMAYFLQVTFSNAVRNRVRPLVGDKGMEFLQRLSERLLVLAYFVIVGGSWSVVFGYIYPWLLFESPSISNGHAVVGVVVFFACFFAWGVANNSRPGIITPRSFRRYDHYPYDNLMFQPNALCQTTKILKLPRCKYDRMKYNGLVPRYDHYCGWTNNTYGEENYRWFLLFLLQHVVMCFYGTYVCGLLFAAEIRTKGLMELTFFDRLSGETLPATKFVVFQYLFARRTKEVGVTMVMFLMGIALAFFLGYHVFITCKGETTNENGKWNDVKRWYKHQTRLYETAVREGRVNPDRKSSDDDDDDSIEDEIVNPGPVPKNVYNRGFVENWREVFFPLSLRKDALTMGGYTKEYIQQLQRQNKQRQQQQQSVDSAKPTITPTESLADASSKRKDV